MDAEKQKSEALYEFLAWLEVNKKRVIIGAVVVAAAIGLVMFMNWYGEQKEARASEALAAVELQPPPGGPAPTGVADKLQKVASDYRGTLAAVRAELIRAGVLYKEGKYAEAEGEFAKFVRDHPESRWLGQAYFGVAASLDALNKTNDAMSKYEDFVRRFSNDPNVDQARLNLGVLYEAANKPAEAVKEYDRIIKGMSYSPAQGEAQERQRRLLAKHPELAPVPTNRPPTTLTMPTAPSTGAVPVIRTNLTPGTNLPLVIRPAPPVASPPPAAPPAAPKK